MSVGCSSGFIDDIKFIREVSLKLLDKTNGMKMNGKKMKMNGKKMNDYIAKFLIQFIVLVTNYFLSKFFVFSKKEKK